MPSIGPLEIMLVSVIALIVFGPNKLPEMARTVGRALNEFRRQAQDVKSDFAAGLRDDDSVEDEKPAPTPAPTAASTSAPMKKSTAKKKTTTATKRSSSTGAGTKTTAKKTTAKTTARKKPATAKKKPARATGDPSPGES